MSTVITAGLVRGEIIVRNEPHRLVSSASGETVSYSIAPQRFGATSDPGREAREGTEQTEPEVPAPDDEPI